MEAATARYERVATLADWQQPPQNRWSFQHVRELVPTARIAPARDAPRRLRPAKRAPSIPRLSARGRRLSLDTLLEETYTDGFLVLHDGRVVLEQYLNGLERDTPHLLMSVSKSITATVAGILIGTGKLRPGQAVTDVVPALRGTSFEGCTVRHLLDMRAGTRFNEDYDDPRSEVRTSEQVYGWAPRVDSWLPPDLRSYYTTLENDGEHGGPFRYRSILTDVLGWVLEEAAGQRYAELVSRALWQPMGAEHEAEVTVDSAGNALADGGICCTLRDLARFGRLMLDGGHRKRRQIVPRKWVRDTLTPDADSVAAFAEDAADFPAGAYYRNKWWVLNAQDGIYAGFGINGQMVLIHGPARTVVAKLSTWPEAWSDDRFQLTVAACTDLAEKLARGR
ncbi:MAG: serine hydrolase domain-containing protein [Gaiellales bacterium]